MKKVAYQKIREKVRTGDVFFTASKSLIGRLVRKITRSKVSHVGLFLWFGGRLFTIEAQLGKGVIMSLASDRLTEGYIGRITHERTNQHIEILALDRLGKEYDFWGMIGIKKNTNQKYYCSEFVEEVLGVSTDLSERGTTPDDLARKANILFQLK